MNDELSVRDLNAYRMLYVIAGDKEIALSLARSLPDEELEELAERFIKLTWSLSI